MNAKHAYAVVRIDGPLRIVSTHETFADAAQARGSTREAARYEVMHYLPPCGVRQLTRAERRDIQRLFALQVAVAR